MCSVVTSDCCDVASVLLYLNDKTFLGADGASLAQEVRMMKAHGVEIVVVQEWDSRRGGCPFRRCVCVLSVHLALWSCMGMALHGCAHP